MLAVGPCESWWAGTSEVLGPINACTLVETSAGRTIFILGLAIDSGKPFGTFTPEIQNNCLVTKLMSTTVILIKFQWQNIYEETCSAKIIFCLKNKLIKLLILIV